MKEDQKANTIRINDLTYSLLHPETNSLPDIFIQGFEPESNRKPEKPLF